MLQATEYNPYQDSWFIFATDRLRQDRDIVKRAACNSKIDEETISLSLRNDKAFVLELIKVSKDNIFHLENGEALFQQYKHNFDIALQTTNSGRASMELRDNFALREAAIG